MEIKAQVTLRSQNHQAELHTYHELIFEELGAAHFEVDQGQDGLQLSEADAGKEEAQLRHPGRFNTEGLAAPISSRCGRADPGSPGRAGQQMSREHYPGTRDPGVQGGGDTPCTTPVSTRQERLWVPVTREILGVSTTRCQMTRQPLQRGNVITGAQPRRGH